MQNDFQNLTPELILEATNLQGFQSNGVIYPLNSYENRVYEILRENHEPIIAKFYRPNRWSAETIWDELSFIHSLNENEIPVVPPFSLKHHLDNKPHLGITKEYHYAFFPKFRGQMKAELFEEDLKIMGRTLSRMHNIGENLNAENRFPINPQRYGWNYLDTILSSPYCPDDLKTNLEETLIQAIEETEVFFNESLHVFPIHGDCHLGNLLWNSEGLHIVDFDDMVIGPAVQDVWMLFHGSEEEIKKQQNAFFEGYETFRHFDHNTLILIEPLRTLRMICYCGWLSTRFHEDIFQKSFPYYSEYKYWQEFLLSIKEQISAIQSLY